MNFAQELSSITQNVREQRKRDYDKQAAQEKEKFELSIANAINTIKNSALQRAKDGCNFHYVYGVQAEVTKRGVTVKKHAYLKEECKYDDMSPYWQRIYDELIALGFTVNIEPWENKYPDDVDKGIESGYRLELKWKNCH